jgi:hypothetical protein
MMVAPVSRWLLFLGAGASMAAPTELPNFGELFAGVVGGMGWQWREQDERWHHDCYPSFGQPQIPAEVLFGVLRRFGVAFAAQVAGCLSVAEANAVHSVAARVLAARGSIWTTNIDSCVEVACEQLPRRAGRARPRASRGRTGQPVLESLRSAGPGTLVKFHGTVEDPRTLAFTDSELLAPLAQADIEHLLRSAAGSCLVLYGYRGADADLFHLLERAFDAAAEVIWFEPFHKVRGEIKRAFPRSNIKFLPDPLPENEDEALYATAAEFLGCAEAAGAAADADLARTMLASKRGKLDVTVPLHGVPAIVHARLVERFGDPGADEVALATARCEDAKHMRVRSLPQHLRWARSHSLYNEGIVAVAVEWLAAHRRLLAALRPRMIRDYAITSQHALLLQKREWKAVDDFAHWAVELRGEAADYYYLAYGYRYAMRVEPSRQAADIAQAGLSASGEPERHAGAVLEQGRAAVYQGRFGDAARYAFELRERTGRYAIPRWRAWGEWLEALALCYRGDPDGAERATWRAEERFKGEGRGGPLADLRTARLLADRVRMALGRDAQPDLDVTDAAALGLRYRDDRFLLHADIHLARHERDLAERLLGAVAAEPSCPIAGIWAQFGLAEIDRLNGRARAADRFASLARFANEVGAHWLGAQAAIALELCGEIDAGEEAWGLLPAQVRVAAEHAPTGEPRVLWMMTT